MGNALSIGQKIEMVRSYGLTGQRSGNKAYVSQLTDIKDMSHIQVAMPMEGSRMVLLDVGDKYNLYFYTSAGLYSCLAQVENRYRTGQLYYADLVFLSELEKYQRRQFYRLNCIVDMSYRTITVRGRISGKDSEEEEERLYPGTIIDISGGGLRFNSARQLVPEEEMTVFFRLPSVGGPLDFQLRAKVISSHVLANRETNYETRLEFIDISEANREAIVKYIFEEERKRRKRDAWKSSQDQQARKRN